MRSPLTGLRGLAMLHLGQLADAVVVDPGHPELTVDGAAWSSTFMIQLVCSCPHQAAALLAGRGKMVAEFAGHLQADPGDVGRFLRRKSWVGIVAWLGHRAEHPS